MRTLLCTAGLAWALSGAAQQQAQPSLTAEQIVEKSIEASGGRKALEKVASMVVEGLMGTESDELHNAVKYYAKAPNKRLIVMTFAAAGEMRQGFDGKAGWIQMPGEAPAELTGEQLAGAGREAVFNEALKWRELYPKAELKGQEKVGGREAYAIELTPAAGKPVTHFFDAETFLLVRQMGNFETPQGAMDIRVELSDYRDVGGGVKWPFLTRQVMPVGEVIMRITELKLNAAIDDAVFAKPVTAAPAK